MEFFASTQSASRQRTDCAIVGVYDKGILSDAAEELDRRLGGRIARLVKRGDPRGKLGDSLLLADVTGAACERVALVGLGARANFKRKQYRKALAGAAALVARTGAPVSTQGTARDGKTHVPLLAQSAGRDGFLRPTHLTRPEPAQAPSSALGCQ